MNPQLPRRRALLDKLAICPICDVPVDDVAQLIARLVAAGDLNTPATGLIDLMIGHVRAQHGDAKAVWFREIVDAKFEERQ